MDTPIPLKGFVLFIAFGTMVFILVFCFIKRQITRFTLRSSHGPHAAIGANAPKSLRTEIERKLRRVKEISFEPQLLVPDVEQKLASAADSDPCHYVYRMKAVDSLAILDAELKKCGMPLVRKPTTPLKLFLLDARQNGRPLEGARLDLVEKFANTYEHARHDSSEFTATHYQDFMNLLQQLVTHIREKCRHSVGMSLNEDVSHSGRKSSTSKMVGTSSSALSVQFTSPESPSDSGALSSKSQQRITNYTLAGVVPPDKHNKDV